MEGALCYTCNIVPLNTEMSLFYDTLILYYDLVECEKEACNVNKLSKDSYRKDSKINGNNYILYID